MDLKALLGDENEKPLDRLTPDGGFCRVFRTIGCIGDSLSSGEFESRDEEGKVGYHDYYEYSWGQIMARHCGIKVYNFSRGGMTAKWYWNSFAEENGFWDEDKLCQAYIIALGVNDLRGQKQELGSIADIDLNDYNNNKDTFAGYYARIIQRLKSMQPKARFFLVTFPATGAPAEGGAAGMRDFLYDLTKLFEYTYVIDLEQYGPVYDNDFRKKFYLGGHLNAAGYTLTAQMIESYIDYIVRHHFEDFLQTGFIGKDVHNCTAKW